MPVKPETLIVLLGGEIAGRVHRSGNALKFVYDESWRNAAHAYPLSLSMPLAEREHRSKVVEAFMWGLLPDNDRILDGWAKRFQVSARNAFALLANMGEDCAGAIQFALPDRLDTLLASPGSVDWIDETELGARLASLSADQGTGRSQHDNGQFSLAGAQPKTALIKIGDRWGVPSGQIATTHILKPPSREFDGMVENEHFCLCLAAKLGLRAARSTVIRAADSVAIAVERYDRATVDEDAPLPQIVRIHQEDMCQALGIGPGLKYQNEGGPSAADVLKLIRRSVGGPLRAGNRIDGYVVDDSWLFIDALIFNWLIGGTDAHAKNYSFLIGDGGTVRLAPLYDVASALGYRTLAMQKLKLAMSISGKYRITDVVLRHWLDWSATAEVNAAALENRIRSMANRMPDAASDVAASLDEAGVDHPITNILVARIAERAVAVSRH